LEAGGVLPDSFVLPDGFHVFCIRRHPHELLERFISIGVAAGSLLDDRKDVAGLGIGGQFQSHTPL
jgi:hypothetical protein